MSEKKKIQNALTFESLKSAKKFLKEKGFIGF